MTAISDYGRRLFATLDGLNRLEFWRQTGRYLQPAARPLRCVECGVNEAVTNGRCEPCDRAMKGSQA